VDGLTRKIRSFECGGRTKQTSNIEFTERVAVVPNRLNSPRTGSLIAVVSLGDHIEWLLR
jgi:hypothetical protein